VPVASCDVSGDIGLRREDQVAWITIDRPRAKNALTGAMLSGLTDIVEQLSTDEQVRIVVLRGAGSDFCAGADMGDLASVLASAPHERKTAFEHGMRDGVQPLLRALLALKQPVLASARGHAIGIGVMFLLAADLVIASETTKITVPQVRLGHTIDHGESWLLPRRIGPSKASQLCLLGERMNADDAERFGLANWVTADSELEARTDEVVADLLEVAPIPLARTKALLAASPTASLEVQLQAEVASASACAATADFVEAITAQVERRPPRFVGH
jgi:2-(1,2-epoxy-1,2-dihydrophenyl)acetyl-CoA isomerase